MNTLSVCCTIFRRLKRGFVKLILCIESHSSDWWLNEGFLLLLLWFWSLDYLVAKNLLYNLICVIITMTINKRTSDEIICFELVYLFCLANCSPLFYVRFLSKDLGKMLNRYFVQKNKFHINLFYKSFVRAFVIETLNMMFI